VSQERRSATSLLQGEDSPTLLETPELVVKYLPRGLPENQDDTGRLNRRAGPRHSSRRPSMSQPRTGGCLCGAIRYETVGAPVFTLRCHCRDCQRQSGAAHVPAARVPSAGFRILQGMPRRYVTNADSGNEIVRVFCGDCGTPLYVQVATRPDLGGLRVCTLDDPSWFRPEADIFMRSAQPWDHDEIGVPKYDGYPPDRSYPVVTGP